ncbi:hypothetical protein DY000_02055555 [Brassica cretica]|uniref:Uncharacterized protein n=1 Tax=Brassica cretica TaxID=69181 RepID=A0ABQ7A4P9_BRACR|nr:hypothetical protein DY000_02055555 [Brassica cretica]
MADWGPVVIAVILFVLLTPGLLFQIPARGRIVEFGNMQTSGASILSSTPSFSSVSSPSSPSPFGSTSIPVNFTVPDL